MALTSFGEPKRAGLIKRKPLISLLKKKKSDTKKRSFGFVSILTHRML